MSIIIKTPQQIAGIERAAALTVQLLQQLAGRVRTGVTTIELDKFCHDFIVQHGAIPAPLHYNGFPKSICTSINQVVCHGIPSSKAKLHSGDILNVDITIIKDGYYADTSVMYILDAAHASKAAKQLVAAAQQALYLGIKEVAPGKHFGDIGAAIQEFAQQQRLSVVRDYCGHGVGIKFHEDPYVMHVGQWGKGPVMRPGMVFTIEPMLNLGGWQVEVLEDDWTVVTRDGSLSAQWEHTILVTDHGYRILTWREEENLQSSVITRIG